MKTLMERVRETIAFPIRKHRLAEDVEAAVDAEINAMTPLQMLEAISLALQEHTLDAFDERVAEMTE